MYLLVEITINSTLYRVSEVDLALENPWFKYLFSADKIRFGSSKEHGGYICPSYGGLVLAKSLFASDWPAPVTCPVTLKITETNEAAAVTLFSGSAHLSGWDSSSVSYELYKPEEDTTTSSPNINSTLDSFFTTMCGYVSLTPNTTYSRSTSPNVDFTSTNDENVIDLMHNVCAFYTHFFQVIGTTAYLIDALDTSGVGSLALEEWEYRRISYSNPAAIPKFVCGDNEVAGSYTYGDKEFSAGTSYHDTDANQVTALGNIKTVLEKVQFEIPISLDDIDMTLCKQLTLTDTTLVQSSDITMVTRGLSIDPLRNSVILTGEGTVALT